MNSANHSPSHLPDLPGMVYSHPLQTGVGAETHLYRAVVPGRPGTVLKMVRSLPGDPLDPARQLRFAREVRTLRTLSHPHVLPLLDAGVFGGRAYLTTPYCEGGDLRTLTAARRPLAAPAAWAIVRPVTVALEYLHTVPTVAVDADGTGRPAVGVVHRDVRPENVLARLDAGRPTVLVADYGLAKAYRRAGLSGITAEMVVGGTPPFMCRSQLLAFWEAGPEVDVWAAAALLYWLLTDHTPRDFPAWCDPYEVVATAAPVPVRDRNPAVPPALAEVLDRCLDDESELAVQSAAEFRTAVVAAMGLHGAG